MQIHSYFFGPQDVDPETIIEFPEGVVGLDNCHRFKLFHNEDSKTDKTAMYWLQSLDDPGIILPVVESAGFGFSYEFQLTDTEQQLIQLNDASDAAVLVIVYREPFATSNPTPHNPLLNANINAPLVINLQARLGYQKVINHASYKVHVQDASG